MRVYELTALASALVSLLTTMLLVYVGGDNWYGKLFESNLLLYRSSWAMFALAFVSVSGVFTALTALWTLRMARRQEAAARLAKAAAGGTAWGADLRESALSDEQERLAVVRRTVDRKLAFGLAALLLVAAIFSALFRVLWTVSDDAVAEGLERLQRTNKGLALLPERFRTAAGILLGLAGLSLGLARWQRALARKPGAAPLAGDANLNQVRGLAMLLTGCVLFFDSLDPDFSGRYWRWTALLPAALAAWQFGGRRWTAAGWTTLAAVLTLAGLIGWAGAEQDWSDGVGWLVTACLAWAAIEAGWNAWRYRTDVEGGLCPLPAVSGTVEIIEGRGLTWLTRGLTDNFGAQVDEPGVKYFLLEYAGGSTLAVLFLFYMSTCLVTVDAWEVGIRERFGEPVMEIVSETGADGSPTETARVEILEPGLHWKFPWPIERVIKVPSREVIDSVEFGSQGHDHSTEIVLWNLSHYSGEFEMITGDKYLAAVVATMHYRVVDPELYYRHIYPETAADRADSFAGEQEIEQAVGDRPEPVRRDRGPRHGPRALLSQLGYRAMTDVVGRNSIWAVMAERRRPLEEEIRRLTQQRLDRLRSGVEVVRVNLTDVHPPVKNETAMQFELVLQSMEIRMRDINAAEAEANQVLPEAKGTSQELIASATSEGYSRARSAFGEAAVHRAMVRAARGAGAGSGSGASALAEASLTARTVVQTFKDKAFQTIILPPGLNYRLLIGDERALEDVIPEPPKQAPRPGG